MPQPLSYDTFPPEGTLRRQTVGQTLMISSTAVEPGAGVTRELSRRALLGAALVACALLFVLGLMFGTIALRNRHALMWAAIPAFMIFCGALLAFIWYGWRRKLIDRAAFLLQQRTVVGIEPQGLQIESNGPLGETSEKVGFDSIEMIHAPKDSEGIRYLSVLLRDGRELTLFQAHDSAELAWLERAITVARESKA